MFFIICVYLRRSASKKKKKVFMYFSVSSVVMRFSLTEPVEKMEEKEMPKTIVKEEGKAGKKKEEVGPKAEEGKLEKKSGKEKEKEEAAESELGKRKGGKVEGKAGKAEMEPKREEKEAEKVKVVAEKKVEPEKKEVREGGAKVEGVAEVKAEVKKEESPQIEELIGTIEKMTVLELSALVKALEERFGVVAAAPAPAGMASTATPVEEAKEKTEWSVILTAVGEKKIQVIKEVRAITSLGLKEAKTLVEEAPKLVKEGIPQKEAEEIKAKLEAVGATVELK